MDFQGERKGGGEKGRVGEAPSPVRIRKLVILVIVVGKRTHVSANKAAGNQSKYCNS